MNTRRIHALSGLALLIFGCLTLAGCAPETPSISAERPAATGTSVSTSSAPTAAGQPVNAEGALTAYFFDVGQGDATLLAGPDFTILIDAGRHDRRDVVPHLNAAGVESIDLLIGTHVHADHIGQFPQVLEAFPVSEVWLSGDEHNTRTFERALDAILVSEASYHQPRAGEVYEMGSARVEVLNPAYLTGDLHEGCVCVRVVFGNVGFVFTGDAETHTERDMIERGHALQAQILQLGHHGSRTSSGLEFLQAVKPEVAIYSAVIDSSYGHPHREVVDRVAQQGIELYGTPEWGTLRVITDGNSYQVQSERQTPVRGPPGQGVAQNHEPQQININSASRDQLLLIAHIGPERADQLIRLRPFRNLDELTQIDGISTGRLQEIKQQGLAGVE